MMKILNLILTVFFLSMQYKIWIHNGGLRQQLHQMEQNAHEIQMKNQVNQKRNDLLHAEVQDLQTGFEAMAEVARNDKGFIQRGETYYQIK